jgi:hypothetical protein
MEKGLQKIAEAIALVGLAYLAIRYNNGLCGVGAFLMFFIL